MLTNITVDCENFIHIVSRKQKLQLSELKKVHFSTVSLCLLHNNTENVDKAIWTAALRWRKAKVNANYYVNKLLPNLIEDCRRILQGHFISQQDGAPANTVLLTQDWLSRNCPKFIRKDEWPPNSPDLNPLDYHVRGAMLELYVIRRSQQTLQSWRRP